MSGAPQTLLKSIKKVSKRLDASFVQRFIVELQVPSKVIEDQISGKSIFEQYPKPKIIQFLNIGDNSIYTDCQVNVDEPIFQPEPHVIQFTNYEELQTKEQILKLR